MEGPELIDLIKNFTDFVSEITILLEPIQAQINILRHWKMWKLSLFHADSPHPDTFGDEIRKREESLEFLSKLREKARESQALVGVYCSPRREISV